MGDVIFHIPLANLFKSQGWEVGWLVSEKGYELIKGNPCVDRVFLAPLKQWKKRGLSIKNFIEYATFSDFVLIFFFSFYISSFYFYFFYFI